MHRHRYRGDCGDGADGYLSPWAQGRRKEEPWDSLAAWWGKETSREDCKSVRRDEGENLGREKVYLYVKLNRHRQPNLSQLPPKLTSFCLYIMKTVMSLLWSQSFNGKRLALPLWTGRKILWINCRYRCTWSLHLWSKASITRWASRRYPRKLSTRQRTLGRMRMWMCLWWWECQLVQVGWISRIGGQRGIPLGENNMKKACHNYFLYLSRSYPLVGRIWRWTYFILRSV